MRTESLKIYSFNELSDDAKETARDWWRQCENTSFSPNFQYDDFEAVAAILGIEFDQTQIPLMNGSSRRQSKIYWSGFSSQGDGACFEGYYSYSRGAAQKIRDYAPLDKTLHQIADDLQAAQTPAFYRLRARIDHAGHYYHAYSMRITVEHDDRTPSEGEEDVLNEAMRDFANWMYRAIETEYEYQMSDGNVDDSIQANEYEFTEDGSIH